MRKDLLTLLGFSRVEEFDPQTLWDAAVPGGPIKVPVGTTADEATVWLDFGLFGGADHVLVVGTPGSGTSTLLRTLSIALSTLRPTTLLNFLAVQARPGVESFGRLSEVTHCCGVIDPKHGDTYTANRAAQWLMGEIERRRDLFAAAGVANISEYQVRSAANDAAADVDAAILPELFVVIDDVTWLMDSDFDIISRILRADGANLGIRMIMGVRYDTWVQQKDSGYFDQITPRFTLGLDAAGSSAVFGTTVAGDLEVPGQAYVHTDDGELVRCDVVTTDDPYRAR